MVQRDGGDAAPPRADAPPRPWHHRHAGVLVLVALTVLAAVSGWALGRFMRFDLPDVRVLEDYNPPVMSRLLAADSSTVASFAEERRILIGHHEIPPVFKQALIAVEDSSFYRHPGIDARGIARALYSDVRHLSMAQGASTLTQQLARNLFLTPDKKIKRKVQEAMLALEIERQYTKQEILRFYCNQVYMGHGRYGLEAASRFYFDKAAAELTLTEAATIAGLIQRPEALSPIKHPARALERRNHVLRRMAAEGFLSPEDAAEAAAAPLDVARSHRPENNAPYFVEEVRRWLQDEYGSTGLYKEGLEVQTTLNPELQDYANAAVEVGVRQLDKRQGWRGVERRIPEGADPQTWLAESWDDGLEIGAVVDGVVTATARGRADVRVGPWSGELNADAIQWTGQKDPDRLLDAGDVIRVRLVAVDESGRATLALEQEPLAEAALVALDPATGEILALVGGFDFERSEYDRAMQAKRQTGSAFKPFVFAAALSQGFSLADTILDEPTVFVDRRMPDAYQPENFSNDYYQTLTLRRALEKSANIATVKLLTQIGYESTIETAHKLGIRSNLQPYPSLALGAFEVTLLELTSAYAALANQGVAVQPHLVREVRNRDGVVLATVEPEVRDALRPEIAYLMNRVLEGVITDGTGKGAAGLPMTLAGKTGTTDANTDAWFVGYSPTLAVGVWVGFDEPRSLGRRETGAIAALPIWKAFMEKAAERTSGGDFARPSGIVVVAIDKKTGLKANLATGCEEVISEVFLEGTEPTGYCSKQHHTLMHFPYPFQRFPIDQDGRLAVPADALQALLERELDIYLVDDGRRLEAHTPEGVFELPLTVTPAAPPTPTPEWVAERFDPEEWSGLDGRPARIVVLSR